MARSEARLSVEIWNDPDFRALTPGEQRMFMFVISQADLQHTGLIALRIRRWANAATGLTIKDVECDLEGLERARFFVIDWDAEELLVRSFIRRDKVYRQPQVLAVAAEQLTLATSLPLRVALRVELQRIAELEMAPASRPIIESMVAELATVVDGNVICGNSDILTHASGSIPKAAGGEGGRQGAAEGAPQALGDKGLVAAVTTDSPKPQDPDPQPQNLFPLAALGESEKPKPLGKREIDSAFARFWNAYPRKVSKGDALKVFTRLAKAGTDLEAIVVGAARYRDDGPRQRSEIKFTKHPDRWLNAQCWLDEVTPEQPHGRDSPPESTASYYEPFPIQRRAS